MGILQTDRTLGSLANMGDDVLRANRIMADQFGDRRAVRGLRVEKEARPLAFEEGDAPAVGMDVGAAATRLKTGEGEADVGRHVAIHAEQLTHGLFLFGPDRGPLADLDLKLDDALVAPQAETGFFFRLQGGDQVEHDLRVADCLATYRQQHIAWPDAGCVSR